MKWIKTHPPLSDQSFWVRSLVGASFWSSAVQNQPLMWSGWRSGLSHPLKSQRRPEVQMYLTLSTNNKIMLTLFYTRNLEKKKKKTLINYFVRCDSWWIRFRPMFRATRGPCSAVCRSFSRSTSQLPGPRFSHRPTSSSSPCRWNARVWFLKEDKNLNFFELINIPSFISTDINLNLPLEGK